MGKGKRGDVAARTLRAVPSSKGIACQKWECSSKAKWNIWSGYYCDKHAERAGWFAEQQLELWRGQ